ncbi:hypothetical protein TRSC58_07642 [Trypanosoma rangeli SC58]|uniref:Uncharacterized protein n=1 Tax=Trypanosoma rangeli SC58 TaxID=429131 RepID=A0A061IRI9_TRYRA|nr:hypothetical protein TRSC58_07642 [Trypanosoma rangeli SC58]
MLVGGCCREGGGEVGALGFGWCAVRVTHIVVHLPAVVGCMCLVKSLTMTTTTKKQQQQRNDATVTTHANTHAPSFFFFLRGAMRFKCAHGLCSQSGFFFFLLFLWVS